MTRHPYFSSLFPKRLCEPPARGAALPTGPSLSSPDMRHASGLPPRRMCEIVSDMTIEMAILVSDRAQLGRQRRRTMAHARQIAMYVCHVGLGLSQSEIGAIFGRDRTTVSHSCAVVEDRRDEAGYDDFVSAVERLAISVFGAKQEVHHAG